jgi:hypothetical protein
LCNVEFNPCSIALPNFGATLAWRILSRISEDLMEKQEVDKRVRSLTKLTKDHAVAELAANYFDSVHPLPEVYLCILVVEFIGFELYLSLLLC